MFQKVDKDFFERTLNPSGHAGTNCKRAWLVQEIFNTYEYKAIPGTK